MKKVFIGTAVVLVLALLAACSGAGGAAQPSTNLKVEMSEFAFAPVALSVPAGKEITLELKNSGAIQHDFIILKKGIVVQGKFDHDKQMDDIYFSAILDAGKSDTYTFTAPAEAGEYQVVCGIAGHFQAGMIGTLTVVAP